MSPVLVTSRLLHTPFHTDDKNHDSNQRTQSEMKQLTAHEQSYGTDVPAART